MKYSDKLYRINDILTQLKGELDVEFDSDDEEDQVLNDLTHEIATEFKIEEDDDD